MIVPRADGVYASERVYPQTTQMPASGVGVTQRVGESTAAGFDHSVETQPQPVASAHARGLSSKPAANKQYTPPDLSYTRDVPTQPLSPASDTHF